MTMIAAARKARAQVELAVGSRRGGAVAADGYPIPSARLIYTVAGPTSVERFLEMGKAGAATLQNVLKMKGYALAGDVLDFGCGCGRVIRHLARTNAQLHGCDYNRWLVEWAHRNLTFADFARNQLRPPLPYPDASFDIVYAFSVFTHLTVENQAAWRDELARVLRHGGLLIPTFHGDAYADGRMTEPELREYRAGKIVVRAADHEGENWCASFHPGGTVEALFNPAFELVHFEPEGARGNPDQDLYLLRRY